MARERVKQDATVKCFVSGLDKFGIYLALNEGKKGKPLTATQYFKHSKMWLFELFPVQRHIVEAKLLSMGKTLDSFCMKRDGKLVNKAPTCSTTDLNKMMFYLNENASSASDYQDMALLCLLWYLLDELRVRRSHVSDALTSRSFRRGNAQHINSCDGLLRRWSFDRGAWNMSATNNEFNYIFKISREDHKVSKSLSGYDTKTKVKALDLEPFDTETQEKIADV
ncbi:LOW QUALITY PROTEIN: hypothetical protein PHPALM_30889 [Phytophthora palmivora]|uniref:Uncharacterized protein n=1 Tax=Phytophthora palmivora TaxID=4796 RepID=A0A2P4X3Z3_9STRA|nr:LOW QUALITY PROTEIN: hypothetical protein PHPALM_30889 [Phytophthora palmivora]